jgi:hypothetical protein
MKLALRYDPRSQPIVEPAEQYAGRAGVRVVGNLVRPDPSVGMRVMLQVDHGDERPRPVFRPRDVSVGEISCLCSVCTGSTSSGSRWSRARLSAPRSPRRRGWESVSAGEHYVLPELPTKQSPALGRTPMLDPFVALRAIASHTSRLLLGTGTVVPLHQPLALAKRVASLDRLSAGRFLFGIGAGYLAREFRALGAPMDRRGDRVSSRA